MKILFRLTQTFLDKLIFALGIFAGSQLPGFIIQYRQRLGGHLEQAKKQLKSFQEIAEKFHGGSIESLISKHLTSTDPTFNSEGIIIRNSLNEVNRLSESYKALDSNLPGQIKFLLFNTDWQIALQTWEIYEPGLILTPQAVIFALLSGFLLSLLFYGLIKTFGLFGSRINSRMNKKKDG